MIGVFGSTTCKERSTMWRVATLVGSELGKRGYILLTGASSGVSAAAGHGALKQGGVVLGILPASVAEGEEATVDRTATSLIIKSGLVPKGRNVVTVLSCSAAIVIGGGYGTLNEITIAMANQIPLVVIEGLGGAADLMREIVKKLGGDQNITFVTDAVEAVRKVDAVVQSTDKRCQCKIFNTSIR